jgi:renalase
MIMNRRIPDIAVIGAGPAGLSCAERLSEHGLQVQIYDEGKLPGGRTGRKTIVGLTFEHGAPDQQPLIESLTDRVSVHQDTRITSIEHLDGVWRLHLAGLPLKVHHAGLVLAVPAPRAIALWPHLRSRLHHVRMRPVLTALLGLPGPLSRAWNTISFQTDSLAEARRQAPGRTGSPEAWVLYASDVFSHDNLNCDLDTVAQHLWNRFRDALSLDITVPSVLRGHRWRHALTVDPLGQSCLYDEHLGLGVCGDWCLGDHVAAAVASGQTLADRMLGTAERPPRITFSVKPDHS